MGNEQKTFVPREKICQLGCENCIVRNFGNSLVRNELSPKIVIFLSFPTFSDDLVGAVVKTEIYVSIRTLSADFCLKNFHLLHQFWTSSEQFFGLVAKNSQQVCQNFIVSDHRNFFVRNAILRKNIYSFWSLSEIKGNVCSFEVKRSRMGCQNRIVRNQGNIFEKKVMFEGLLRFLHFFRTLSGNFLAI